MKHVSSFLDSQTSFKLRAQVAEIQSTFAWTTSLMRWWYAMLIGRCNPMSLDIQFEHRLVTGLAAMLPYPGFHGLLPRPAIPEAKPMIEGSFEAELSTCQQWCATKRFDITDAWCERNKRRHSTDARQEAGLAGRNCTNAVFFHGFVRDRSSTRIGFERIRGQRCDENLHHAVPGAIRKSKLLKSSGFGAFLFAPRWGQGAFYLQLLFLDYIFVASSPTLLRVLSPILL